MLEPEATPPAAEPATKAVDLAASDDSFKVNIADALNEQDVVKFTVHTQTNLQRFSKREFQVTRQHEEFVWLHDRYVENEDNHGYIIPPCPPKPDFSQSHGKLAKLQAGDPSMPQEELEKLKQEIQSEYLAAFQKTVAMHEVFLMRCVSHPVLREDSKLQVFLEYDKDLETRGRSKKEKLGGFFSRVSKAVDSSFNNHTDSDEFFESNKQFIGVYNLAIKETKKMAEDKVKKRAALVSQIDKSALYLLHLGNTLSAHESLCLNMRKVGEAFGKSYQHEKKLAAKEDLKLTDLLRYYVADGQAAKDLLWRRIKAYNAMKDAETKLAKAKLSGKKVVEAQDLATATETKYNKMTDTAKQELQVFKKRRVAAFRKGLIQYSQCQIRQAKEQHNLWKELVTTLKQ